jgi:SAM-dependent methyltransferase
MNERSTFFEDLVNLDRKLELDYEHASTDAGEGAKHVRAVVADFLGRYAAFNGISKEAARASYATTIRRYANDIAAFVKTGRYPLELDNTQAPLARLDYDLFLLLTILVTKHRCAIMEEIAKIPAAGRVLVIGVGSGVELALINAPGGGDAYDLYINPFARSAFPRWRFREELYRSGGDHYDALYAIELIEHLDQPYEFLADCSKSLSPGGRLIVTTAVNVPQFDHRYNFTSDEEFEQRACETGLVIEHKRVIPHAYPRTEIGARNVFYVFTRKATHGA